MKIQRPMIPLAMFALLAAAGCVKVDFMNPPPKDTIVSDTQEYGGTWTVAQLFGKPYTNEAARHVTMRSLQDGRLAISIKAANPGLKGFDTPMHLYKIAGQTYLGSPSLRVVLDSTNLYVYSIDVSSVADHIKQGKVEGHLAQTKDGDVEATVTASSDAVVKYLTTDAEFLGKPAAVLTRKKASNQVPVDTARKLADPQH